MGGEWNKIGRLGWIRREGRGLRRGWNGEEGGKKKGEKKGNGRGGGEGYGDRRPCTLLPSAEFLAMPLVMHTVPLASSYNTLTGSSWRC